MKVLIIDDHPVFASALETILQGIQSGISVHIATSINTALEYIAFNSNLQIGEY